MEHRCACARVARAVAREGLKAAFGRIRCNDWKPGFRSGCGLVGEVGLVGRRLGTHKSLVMISYDFGTERGPKIGGVNKFEAHVELRGGI